MKESIDYSVIPDFEECLPRISLIIPYSPTRKTQAELISWLTLEADRIENDLMKNYCNEKTTLIIKKLRHLIEGISLKRDKSIGIFLSPSSEKVYYFTPTDPSKISLPPVLAH